MTDSREGRSGPGGAAAAVGAVLLVVACCALGPALVAGGALGVAAAALHSPALLSLAALILVGALWSVMRRRARARQARAIHTAEDRDAGDCCSSRPADDRVDLDTHDPPTHAPGP